MVAQRRMLAGLTAMCDERGDSVVELLTRDRGVTGSSFTEGAVLGP